MRDFCKKKVSKGKNSRGAKGGLVVEGQGEGGWIAQSQKHEKIRKIKRT